jgi:hypothetical protein
MPAWLLGLTQHHSYAQIVPQIRVAILNKSGAIEWSCIRRTIKHNRQRGFRLSHQYEEVVSTTD